MLLRFCSRDKLAWMLVDDREYFITLVRDGNQVEKRLAIGDLLHVINSTIHGSSETGLCPDDFNHDVKAREQLGMSVAEAERLKECYVNMKIYNGHAI